MTKRNKVLQSRLLGSTAFASALLIGSPAFAQAQNPAQETREQGTLETQADVTPADPGVAGEEDLGEIVVTGR